MNNFISIKEALETCDKEKLYNEVLKSYDYTENQKYCADLTMNFIDKCLKLDIYKSDIFNIVTVQFYNEYDSYSDAFYNQNKTGVLEITKEIKLNKFKFDQGLLDNINALIDENVNDLRHNFLIYNKIRRFINVIYKKVPVCGLSGGAYDLCSTNEILGYYIPKSLIKRYGLEKILSVILFEMTFFGFDVDNNNKEIENVYSVLNKAAKEADKLISEELPIDNKETENKETTCDKENKDATENKNNISKEFDSKQTNYEQKAKTNIGILNYLLEKVSVFNDIVEDYNSELKQK